MGKLYFIGQEIKDFTRTFHIKQDGIAINFSVQDVDSKPIKRYNQELFYYWYKAPTLARASCSCRSYSKQRLYGSNKTHFEHDLIYFYETLMLIQQVIQS